MTHVPHPTRLNPDRPDFAAIMSAHNEAVAQGRRYYFDPSTQLVVLTVTAHLERGSCCGNGCRHCPWVGPS